MKDFNQVQSIPCECMCTFINEEESNLAVILSHCAVDVFYVSVFGAMRTWFLNIRKRI